MKFFDTGAVRLCGTFIYAALLILSAPAFGQDAPTDDSALDFDAGGSAGAGTADSQAGFESEGGFASGADAGFGFDSSAGDSSFGFGFESEGGLAAAAAASPVTLGGSVSAGITGFVKDWGEDDAARVKLGDVFSGTVSLKVESAYADALIKLKLKPTFDDKTAASPVELDEAYLRAYYGGFDIEAGLRKLTWGKADSMGPLDVINPLDYSDLSGMGDPAGMKIARPLLHFSYNFGSFTKAEAVFVPWFAGHSFATEGRWQPAQMKELSVLISMAEQGGQTFKITQPDTQTIRYMQAGARFTTTIGSTDLGIQYYYGLLPRPAPLISPSLLALRYAYNWFHQIGADYAQVLAGFNVRAEFAAHFTADMKGDKPNVYNPFLAWSLGFDRDIIAGININLQGTGMIRLFNDKINNQANPRDIEAETTASKSRITANISKKFLRDELELKAAAVWGIEDKDFLIMPGLVWTKDALSFELSGGIFGGDEDGELGQYRDNSFVYAGLKYSF
ncbi:MAG: hypothetical protein LBO67_08565 [Spirochaetaceae bacterium]|jgi:hypothetical protein|nr:hypothetical protein [Spirochaetaceae bacterium]